MLTQARTSASKRPYQAKKVRRRAARHAGVESGPKRDEKGRQTGPASTPPAKSLFGSWGWRGSVGLGGSTSKGMRGKPQPKTTDATPKLVDLGVEGPKSSSALERVLCG